MKWLFVWDQQQMLSNIVSKNLRFILFFMILLFVIQCSAHSLGSLRVNERGGKLHGELFYANSSDFLFVPIKHMHRVLSYQTAMQINDDRDIRTYITKRTCISLIFSASFFTLIIGFLLGKFVSDRQYKIRQLTQPKYVAVIEQIHTLRRSIETSAQNISDSTFVQTHPKYNRLLWDEAASCSDKTIEQTFDVSLEDFVESLVDNELKIVVQCLNKLNNIINTIGRD